jgi:hypothetical protein
MAFYGSPEYEAWQQDVNERIAGINFVIANYRRHKDKPMKLPVGHSEMFRRGALTGIKHYGGSIAS